MFAVSWFRIVNLLVLSWALIAVGTAFARARQPIRKTLLDGTILFASAIVFTSILLAIIFATNFFSLDDSTNIGDRVLIREAILAGSLILGTVLTLVGNFLAGRIRRHRSTVHSKTEIASSSHR